MERSTASLTAVTDTFYFLPLIRTISIPVKSQNETHTNYISDGEIHLLTNRFITFTYMYLADAFIQNELQCVEELKFSYQYV